MKRAMYHVVDDFESKSRFGMFQAQLQLRLLCNHGTFQRQFRSAGARTLLHEREDALAIAGTHGEMSCSVCKRLISTFEIDSALQVESLCAHVLCLQCQPSAEGRCPLCQVTEYGQRATQTDHAHHGAFLVEEYFHPEGRSSKMDALIRDIKDSDAADKR